MAEAAVAMVAEMTAVSGSSFFYSAVAEMDSDLAETVVDATVVATTDAASYLGRGCVMWPLLHTGYYSAIQLEYATLLLAAAKRHMSNICIEVLHASMTS